MSSSTSTLELDFFYLYQMCILKFNFSFNDKIIDIKFSNYKVNLPDDLFNNGKDKSVISITLYTNKQFQNFPFYVNKGENKVYIGLDYLFGSVYQLIIYSKEKYTISQLSENFDKFDSLGNKYRRRYTFINTDSKFVLDGKSVNFNIIARYNYEDKSESPNEFFQISAKFEKDINGNKIQNNFIVKKIQKDIEKDDIKSVLDNEKNLNDFWTELEIALKNDNIITSYENLKYKYGNIFNMKIPYIKENNQYINNYNIDDLLSCFIAFFVTIVLRKYSILKGEKYLKEVFEKAKKDFEVISKKTNLNNEEKLKILSTYLLLYSDCEDSTELELIKIKSFIFSEKEDNSIMDKVYQFYQSFFNGLTEDSNIFFYLLQLNSGIGFSQRQKVYTFDLTTVEMVKNHLDKLFPKFLTIYDYNISKERSYQAFCSEQTGGMAIDQNYLIPNDKCKDIDFNSKALDISQNDSNEIAMNIVLFLFHEFMGHKKFRNSEANSDSPIKIVRNNKIIKLKYELDFKKNDENSEYILTTKDKKGDSGHFLELCFNKFNGKLIMKHLIKMKNKGKLVKRAGLFIKSPELIEKYVTLRKIAEEKEMSFNFNDSMSIEDEISEMNSKIDIDKYMKEKREKEEKEEKKGKKNKSTSSHKKSKKSKGKSHLKLSEKVEEINSYDEIEEEEEENSEESEERKEKRKIGDKKMRRILKKFNFKYDEDLKSNVENKMDETGLSQEDYDDLNYLYIKFMKLY